MAELHVEEATGLSVAASGVLTVRSVTRTDWALRTLEAWKPPLERLATTMGASLGGGGDDTGAGGLGPGAFGGALGGPFGPGGPGPGGTGGTGGTGGGPGSAGSDPVSQLFANLPQVLGPFLFGMQIGAMVGDLASRAMGQYDLPMPRPPDDELLMVPATIDAFAADWSLPADDVRLWVCLREVTHHAILSRPHVRARIDGLSGEYAGAFHPDPEAMGERLAGLDPTDLGALQSALGDPETLLGEMQTDEQRRIQAPLQGLLAVITATAIM